MVLVHSKYTLSFSDSSYALVRGGRYTTLAPTGTITFQQSNCQSYSLARYLQHATERSMLLSEPVDFLGKNCVHMWHNSR